MVLITALSSAFFVACVNILVKLLFKGHSTKDIAPLNFLLNSITMVILLLLMPHYFQFSYTPRTMTLMVIILILDALSNYFYFTSIEKCEVTYASIYMSLSPIFTLFIFTLFINVIPLKLIVSVLGIVISIYVLNLNHNTSLLDPLRNAFKNYNYLGIIYAVFAGISAIFTKQLFNENTINPPTLYLFRSIWLFAAFSIYFRPSFKSYDFKIITATWLRVIFVVADYLLYLYAISLGNVIVASTVMNIYPVFVLIFSFFIFKEKITVQKVFAITSIACFITLIDYSFK